MPLCTFPLAAQAPPVQQYVSLFALLVPAYDDNLITANARRCLSTSQNFPDHDEKMPLMLKWEATFYQMLKLQKGIINQGFRGDTLQLPIGSLVSEAIFSNIIFPPQLSYSLSRPTLLLLVISRLVVYVCLWLNLQTILAQFFFPQHAIHTFQNDNTAGAFIAPFYSSLLFLLSCLGPLVSGWLPINTLLFFCINGKCKRT